MSTRSIYFRRDRMNKFHKIREAVVRILFDGVDHEEIEGEYSLNGCIMEITCILFNKYPERGSLPDDQIEGKRAECVDGIVCRLTNYFGAKEIRVTGKLAFEKDAERARQAYRVQIPELIAELNL